jgi:ABC-type amino acid transport substrate-binding protein
VGAAGAAVAAVVGLVLLLGQLSGDEEPPARGQGEDTTEGGDTTGGSDTGNEDGQGADPGAEEQTEEAPLHHLLPRSVQEEGHIRVHSWTADLPPLSFESGGDRVGVEPDLAAALGERLGVEFEFSGINGNHDDVLQQLVLQNMSGNQDDIGMASLQDTPEIRNEGYLEFVDHLREGYVLVVRETDAATVDALGDLCGRTVATWDAPAMGDLIRPETSECGERVEISGHVAADEIMEAVRSGQADAAFLPYADAAHLTATGDGDLVVTGEQVGVQLSGIAVSEGNPDLRDAIREALQSLIDDGTYGEILQRWNVPDLAVDTATLNAGE